MASISPADRENLVEVEILSEQHQFFAEKGKARGQIEAQANICRSITLFTLLKEGRPLSTTYEQLANESGEFFRDVRLVGFVAPISGDSRFHIMAGWWDIVSFGDMEHGYMELSGIQSIYQESCLQWRGSKEPIMWVDTRRGFSYAMQKPAADYRSTWEDLVASFAMKHGNRSALFRQFPIAGKKPVWWTTIKSWNAFIAHGQNSENTRPELPTEIQDEQEDEERASRLRPEHEQDGEGEENPEANMGMGNRETLGGETGSNVEPAVASEVHPGSGTSSSGSAVVDADMNKTTDVGGESGDSQLDLGKDVDIVMDSGEETTTDRGVSTSVGMDSDTRRDEATGDDMEEVPETDDEEGTSGEEKLEQVAKAATDIGVDSTVDMDIGGGRDTGCGPELEKLTGPFGNMVAILGTGEMVGLRAGMNSNSDSRSGIDNTPRNSTELSGSSQIAGTDIGSSQGNDAGHSTLKGASQPLLPSQFTPARTPRPSDNISFPDNQQTLVIPSQSATVTLPSFEAGHPADLNQNCQDRTSKPSILLPTASTSAPNRSGDSEAVRVSGPAHDTFLKRSTSILEKLRQERAKMANKGFESLLDPIPERNQAYLPTTINPTDLSILPASSISASTVPPSATATSAQYIIAEPPQSTASSNIRSPTVYIQTDFDSTRVRPRTAQQPK